MKKIPKYKTLRIFIISALFYFFLVMPFLGFIFIQKIPDLMNRGFFTTDSKANVGRFEVDFTDTVSFNDTIMLPEYYLEYADSLNQAIVSISDTSVIKEVILASDSTDSSMVIIDGGKEKPGYFAKSFDIFFYGIIISLIILMIFSYPFKRYFRRKRKGKPISTRLEFFCRRYLLYTPALNTLLFALVIFSTVGYIGYIYFYGNLAEDIGMEIFDEYFYIATLSGFLSTLFVYYWHQHRVHLFYLEVLFSEEELRKRIFKTSLGGIRNRLWLASGMTTLLPLSIVIFYLILSVTRISDLTVATEGSGIRDVLLGEYAQIFSDEDLSDLYYVNSVNTYMMFFGIGTSIFVSLMYILSFVRWTTLDIVYPVKELLRNMQKTGDGKTTNFSIVRTNDEIGELTEGYNIMSQRIINYIDNINEINNSYYRFVPKQFLDFLNKKDITDIHLGDQVQKEMTVMFSDIRSFTEISENLNPRENFNFINHYLGYMEPIISHNHGFIDKYIGDAIMALFPDSPDDAIDAAIEMRVKLDEFNEDLILNGKKPIDSGIGLNTGNLMLGIVGGKGRLEGTVISDHVNLASRLEGLTKRYGSSIIISQDTLIKLKHPENYHYRFLDNVKVKGKRNSVNIFEILDGEQKELREAKMATNKDFSSSLQLYRGRDFKQALIMFQEILLKSPEDKACELYIKRCKSFLEKGVPEDWDGSEIWNMK